MFRWLGVRNVKVPKLRSAVAVAVSLMATVGLGSAAATTVHAGTARSMSAASRAVVLCAPGPLPSTKKSPFNTTPPGPGPWHVPRDPCNSELLLHWDNCAYWAEEKRPDVWRDAVMRPGGGYSHGNGGAWNIKIDAKKYHFKITHKPKVGDLAAWPPNAIMGSHKFGVQTITHVASPGGHVAYVEKVHGKRITISTTGLDTVGGYTFSLKFSRHKTYFIHHGRTQ
jgi:surface antigen